MRERKIKNLILNTMIRIYAEKGDDMMYISEIYDSINKKNIDYNIILKYCKEIYNDGHLLFKERTTKDGDCSHVCFTDTKNFMRNGGYHIIIDKKYIIKIIISIIFSILGLIIAYLNLKSGK